jgi:hypothetical protein
MMWHFCYAGDIFRWRDVWPQIADWFGLKAGLPLQVRCRFQHEPCWTQHHARAAENFMQKSAYLGRGATNVSCLAERTGAAMYRCHWTRS